MEELKDFMGKVLFRLGGAEIDISKSIVLLVILILSLVLFNLLTRFLPNYFAKYSVQAKEQKSIRNIIRVIIVLLVATSLVWAMGWNIDIFSSDKFNFSLSLIHLFEAVLILQMARLIDWVISRVIIHNYYTKRDEKSISVSNPDRHSGESYANRTAQYIAYLIAAIFILQKLNIDYNIIATEAFTLNISKILLFILILLSARLGVWILINIFLYSIFKKKEIEIGSQYAFNQLLKYVVFVVAFIVALDTIGLKMNLILGGLAALLVGIGLGLQQIFNDLFSGIILLFERTVEIGDVLEIDGEIGIVKKIGLRTTSVESRDNVTLIVPNSKLVSDKVINWNHYDRRARFQIKVGVAYGSDVEKVRNVLKSVAFDSKYTLSFPEPIVRFNDFGSSSLDFEIHFWSTELMNIENVKSDMRFEINRLFKENNIEIPFPQRDVWIRKEA